MRFSKFITTGILLENVHNYYNYHVYSKCGEFSLFIHNLSVGIDTKKLVAKVVEPTVKIYDPNSWKYK